MGKPRFSIILVVSLFALLHSTGASALTIGSFSSPRSTAPLVGGSTDSTSQQELRTELLENGYTINPGIELITSKDLTGVDVFFTSVFTGLLSTEEAAVIDNYYLDGGSIFLEADNTSDKENAANSLLHALGVAANFTVESIGSDSRVGGTITSNDNFVTNGPDGDVRGENYAITPTSGINLGAGKNIAIEIGTITQKTSIALYESGSLFPGSGALLIAGDPFTINLFTQSGQSLFNENNLTLALNFFDGVASAAAPVPEPGTLFLLGSGLMVLVGFRRRLRRSD